MVFKNNSLLVSHPGCRPSLNCPVNKTCYLNQKALTLDLKVETRAGFPLTTPQLLQTGRETPLSTPPPPPRGHSSRVSTQAAADQDPHCCEPKEYSTQDLLEMYQHVELRL